MAITRRQFVTRLGALAAAVGMSQADLSKVTEAFAHTPGAPWGPGWAAKPKVIWVHGAECTGCSTSLLSLFEDAVAPAIEGSTTTTLDALGLIVGGNNNVLNASTGHPFAHRTIHNSAAVTDVDFDSTANAGAATIVTIQDVLIDFIDLQYHETVMGMGGDLAYQWLKDNMGNGTAASGSSAPFVMVVEGAVQNKANANLFETPASAASGTPWCSIGQDGVSGAEASFDDVVYDLAQQTNCAAIISIGQCASFGGYPACKSPVLGVSQTGAKGTYDFLRTKGATGIAAANKVINVPGCPANPWWFVLTTVAWLVDFVNGPLAGSAGPLGILAANGSINGAAVDTTRRLKAVYGTPIHGPACPRYQDYVNGTFATRPGDPGCLQLIGCKGPATNSLCALHGWNSMQPHNNKTWENGQAAVKQYNNGTKGFGSGAAFCVTAGHPCMGCTEQGYPDSVVPFVVR
jgi:hydrogenase small subunit